MASLADVIRRITIRASADGVDQAAASMQKLATSQGAVAVASEKTSAATLSMSGAYDRLLRSIDPAFRAEQNFVRGQELVNKSLQQGVISATEQARAMELLATKYKTVEKGSEGFLAGLGLGEGGIKGLLGGLGIGLGMSELARLPGELAEMVHETAGLEHVAAVIGTTTQNLQELQGVGRLFHISTEDMTTALERFSKGLGLAAEGTGALYKVFSLNHVAITGDFNKDFLSAANLVRGATNEEQKNLLVTQLFGKSAQEMGLLFEHGADGVKAAADEIDHLGGVISDETIKKMSTLDEKFIKLSTTLAVDFKEGVLKAASAISSIGDDMTRLNGLVTEFETHPSWQTFLNAMFGKPGMAMTVPHIPGDTSPQTIAELQAGLAPKEGAPAAPHTILPDQAAEEAQKKIDKITESLKFHMDQLARTSREQAIYNELQQAGVTITSAAGQKIAEATGRLYDMQEAMAETIARLDEIRSIGHDVFSTITSDLQQGAKAGQIFKDVLGNIASHLADMASNSLLDTLLGRGGTAGGGLFGGLFTGGSGLASGSLYHSGGIVGETSVPGRYIHPAYFDQAPRLHSGLMPDEFPAILQRGEAVIPRGGAWSAAGGGVTINAGTTINVAGSADEKTLAAMRAYTDQRDRDLVEKLPAIIRKHQVNGRLD